jgi:hypothetical protein
MSPSDRRSEAFWLALAFAIIHALLLGVIILILWKSPFMLFRLPEKERPAQVAIDPSRPVP